MAQMAETGGLIRAFKGLIWYCRGVQTALAFVHVMLGIVTLPLGRARYEAIACVNAVFCGVRSG